MSSRLAVSRRLAYAFGVVAPLGETVRRWGAWWDYPPVFVDDWLMGALLIAGAWATRDPRKQRGRALLAAGWGFACGMAYASAAAHWVALQAGEIDPAPIPSRYVFAIKVVGLLVAAGALVLTLAEAKEAPAAQRP